MTLLTFAILHAQAVKNVLFHMIVCQRHFARGSRLVVHRSPRPLCRRVWRQNEDPVKKPRLSELTCNPLESRLCKLICGRWKNFRHLVGGVMCANERRLRSSFRLRDATLVTVQPRITSRTPTQSDSFRGYRSVTPNPTRPREKIKRALVALG